MGNAAVQRSEGKRQQRGVFRMFGDATVIGKKHVGQYEGARAKPMSSKVYTPR